MRNKLDTCENKEAGLRGMGENSRWEKWKQEKIRDRKGERLSVQGAGVLEGKGRQETGTKGTFAGLQNRERGKRREEGGKRVSGWFIESLSGAVDLCAVEGAGGGAFI